MKRRNLSREDQKFVNRWLPIAVTAYLSIGLMTILLATLAPSSHDAGKVEARVSTSDLASPFVSR